jgi:hypothetical protein
LRNGRNHLRERERDGDEELGRHGRVRTKWEKIAEWDKDRFKSPTLEGIDGCLLMSLNNNTFLSEDRGMGEEKSHKKGERRESTDMIKHNNVARGSPRRGEV